MTATDAAAALAEAREALAAGEESRALARTVDAWRVTRSAEIARVAEALSRRLEPHLPPLDGKLAEVQPLWLAIAKRGRAVDLPRLLGSVLHGTNRFGTAVVDALVARGEALAAWPADPRTSALVVGHLVRGGYESTSRSTYPFWTAMFALLERHADPRVFDQLAKLRFARVFRNFSDGARRIAWFQQQLDTVLARLAARPATGALARDVSARVMKLAKLVAARGPVPLAELARITEPPPVRRPRPKRRAPAAVLDAPAARTHVDEALRALQAGDDGAALRALLEAWRTTRSARVAELVDRVSQRCASRLPRILEDSRAATQRSWLAVCREQRAEDLPRLLAALTATFGRSTDALARVEALASWPSDPRTLAGAIQQLEQPAFYASSTRPFWTALIGLVVDHQDPRAAEALDALAARFRLVSTYQDLSATTVWFKNQLAAAAHALRARAPAPRVLEAATAKSCDAIAAQLATEDQLLAELRANPDDDHPRAVYADVLQQRGDPHGELIALQLAGREPARAAELVRTHAHAWLAPLVPVLDLDACRFERGFLARAKLGDVTAPALEAVTGHPLWTTVTHLDLGVHGRAPRRFLEHPVLARARVSGAGAPRRPRRPPGAG